MSEKELEDLKEQNHKLKLNIESIRQSYKVEVEYLKEEIQAKETELTSHGDNLKAEFKQTLNSFQERLACVNEDFQQSRDENNVLKGQVDQLHKTVEHLRTVQVDRHSRVEQFETVKITVDQLNIELGAARGLLEKQQSKVHYLTQMTEQQKRTIGELKEDLESKDSCISQLQSRMREMEGERQEAILQHQQAVMMQHKLNEDVEDSTTKRGNSLFSEVDKRRMRVEEELLKLRERVARLISENVELQSTLEKGDGRSEIILQQLQLINKSSNELIHEFKKLKSESLQSFDTYRDRLETLKNEYKRKLTQYRSGVDSPGVRELETVREERDLLIGQKMSLERELWEIRKELKHVKHQRTESEANLKILRVKLLAAQEQLELMNKSEKVKSDGSSSMSSSPGRSLNSSLSRSSVGGNSSSGGDRETATQKWLYNSILNDSKRNLPTGSSVPSYNVNKAKTRNSGSSVRTTPGSATERSAAEVVKRSSDTEDIPDCKTQ